MQKFPTLFLGNSISPTIKMKNLGVTFDSGNTFGSHITKDCHACYYHLKDFRHIRKFLIVETAALLANSMISSRIDYCSSLLYCVNKYNVAKLQMIQNALCRIVFRLDKTRPLQRGPRSNLTTSKDSQHMFSYRLFSHPKPLGPIISEIWALLSLATAV